MLVCFRWKNTTVFWYELTCTKETRAESFTQSVLHICFISIHKQTGKHISSVSSCSGNRCERCLSNNQQCDNGAVIKAVISRINFICEFSLLVIRNNIKYICSGEGGGSHCPWWKTKGQSWLWILEYQMSSVEISDSTVDNEQPDYVAAARQHLSIILGQVPQTGLITELHVITSLSTPALITLITRATLPVTCKSGICLQLFCRCGIK